MEEINVLLIKTLHEIHMIGYFIQKHRTTQNSVPTTESKVMQEMPHEQEFHNFSTKGLNEKKALLQIFNAWITYP